MGVTRQDVLRVVKLTTPLVAIFACAAWRVSEATAPSSSLSGKIVQIGVPRPTSTVAVDEDAIAVPDLDVATSEDPFRPFPASEAATPSSPAEASATVAGGATPPALSGALPIAPTPLPIPSAVLSLAKPTPLAAPRLSMRLTGVVVGAAPTAVFSIGGEETVVRLGATLPDGSTVVQIQPTSVTLVRSGKRVVHNLLQ